MIEDELDEYTKHTEYCLNYNDQVYNMLKLNTEI